jgi:hypothetical protein
MLAQGGTKDMTYDQIVTAMFLMATSVGSQAGREMTTFSAVTMSITSTSSTPSSARCCFEPGWREQD